MAGLLLSSLVGVIHNKQHKNDKDSCKYPVSPSQHQHNNINLIKGKIKYYPRKQFLIVLNVEFVNVDRRLEGQAFVCYRNSIYCPGITTANTCLVPSHLHGTP